MAQLCLTRRNGQLALLASACARRQDARISFRDAHAASPSRTRMLALETDALFVSWTDELPPDADRAGRPIEVDFRQDGEAYAAVAETRGRCERELGGGARVAALKLSVPLRVERRHPRCDVRIPIEEMAPIEARMTGMLDQSARFVLRLTNLSRGGAAGRTVFPHALRLTNGSPFWMEFSLPGTNQAFEFAVRLVHARPAPEGAATLLGWEICSHDDPATHDENIRRLECFVAGRK